MLYHSVSFVTFRSSSLPEKRSSPPPVSSHAFHVRTRRWLIPAAGETGANQWYGRIETGCRFDLGTNANAFITPFARLQAYTANQNAFTETGA